MKSIGKTVDKVFKLKWKQKNNASKKVDSATSFG